MSGMNGTDCSLLDQLYAEVAEAAIDRNEEVLLELLECKLCSFILLRDIFQRVSARQGTYRGRRNRWLRWMTGKEIRRWETRMDFSIPCRHCAGCHKGD